MDIVSLSTEDSGVVRDALRFQPRDGYLAVGGIYITDHAVCAMRGQVQRATLPNQTTSAKYWPILVDDLRAVEYEVGAGGPDAALQVVAEGLANAVRPIASIGVGCFGPFGSIDILDRPSPGVIGLDDARYGQVLPNTLHLTGRKTPFNVYDVVQQAFADAGQKPDIQVQTDVAVSAYAESVFAHASRYQKGQLEFQEFVDFRNVGAISAAQTDRHSIACIKVSKGANAAIVDQRDFWPAYRSSEMGNIRVTPHPHDPLPMLGIRPTFEDLVSEAANHERLRILAPKIKLDQFYSGAKGTEKVYAIVAHYVAQLAVSITVTALPDGVVLAGRTLRIPKMKELVVQEFLSLMGDEPRIGSFVRLRPRGWENYIRSPTYSYGGLYGATFFAASLLRG